MSGSGKTVRDLKIAFSRISASPQGYGERFHAVFELHASKPVSRGMLQSKVLNTQAIARELIGMIHDEILKIAEEIKKERPQ